MFGGTYDTTDLQEEIATVAEHFDIDLLMYSCSRMWGLDSPEIIWLKLMTTTVT